MSATPQPVAWFHRGLQRDPTGGTLYLRAEPTGGTLNLQPDPDLSAEQQPPGYQVTPCEWREPWECSAEELTQVGITWVDKPSEDDTPQFWDRDGELDPYAACVPVPVRDPIPHYDRGRARIEPRIEPV